MAETSIVRGAVSHRFVRAGGLRMHVLLHTVFQHWYAWRDVIPVLAQQFRVICPDLRGCGWTDAPRHGYENEALAADVLRLLDASERDGQALDIYVMDADGSNLERLTTSPLEEDEPAWSPDGRRGAGGSLP